MFKSVRKAYKKHYKEKYVMKKITALLLCALLALSAFVLVGCGGSGRKVGLRLARECRGKENGNGNWSEA